MNCPRCRGLMVSVQLDDGVGTTFLEPILGWRCLLCGEVLDDTIASNRAAEQTLRLKSPHPRFRKLLKKASH